MPRSHRTPQRGASATLDLGVPAPLPRRAEPSGPWERPHNRPARAGEHERFDYEAGAARRFAQLLHASRCVNELGAVSAHDAVHGLRRQDQRIKTQIVPMISEATTMTQFMARAATWERRCCSVKRWAAVLSAAA